nr:SPASM domain-containing protein [Desulfobulbaceae bacterium]
MKKFKKIFIEITNNCNLSCSFCHRSKRAKAYMPPEEFSVIIRQAKAFTSYIALHVLGEPLLHPDLGRLLADCHGQNLAVNLTTNGTLLHKRQQILFESPAVRQLNISLHSGAEIDAGAGLSQYLAGIFDFIDMARTARPIYISLRLWNVTEERTSISPHDEFILREIENFFHLPVRVAEGVTPGHGITLAPNIFLSRNARFSWPHSLVPELSSSGFCRGLRDHVAILVDGTVVPCCLDAEADIKLGNIHELSLADILRSSRASAMYEGFSQRRLLESLCRRCSYRESF